MSRKRPSVIEGLDLIEAAPAPVAEPREAVALERRPALPAKAAAKPSLRADIQHTSIYVPKVAYRKIREIAVIGDRKAHDVIMEGVDLVLAKYGFPSVAELKSGKS